MCGNLRDVSCGRHCQSLLINFCLPICSQPKLLCPDPGTPLGIFLACHPTPALGSVLPDSHPKSTWNPSKGVAEGGGPVTAVRSGEAAEQTHCSWRRLKGPPGDAVDWIMGCRETHSGRYSQSCNLTCRRRHVAVAAGRTWPLNVSVNEKQNTRECMRVRIVSVHM